MLSKLTYCFAFSAITFSFMFCNQKAETNQKQEPEPEKSVAAPMIAKPDDAVTIAAQPELDTLKGSLKAVGTGQIGSVNLVINYHSPAVRKRIVWGGLVPYDQVWVTGAHSATSLQTDGPINIGGKQVPAGKYALFTIPGQQEWTVILNKNWEQHLADDYTEKEDVTRVSVQPVKSSQFQERLRYEIKTEGENKGSLVMSWENVNVAVPISL